MNRLAMRMGVALPLLLAGAGWSGAAGQPPAKPAARTKPATAPAPAPADRKPAGADNEKDKDDEAIPEALLATARRGFVIVRSWYKKDVSESPTTAERDWRVSRLYSEYVDRKRPEEKPGVLLGDGGSVLVVDDGIEDRFVDRIEVELAGGKTCRARRARLLLAAPGVVLKIEVKGDRPRGLEFAELEGKGVNTSLLEAGLYRVDDDWRLRVGPIRPSVSFARAAGDNVFYGFRSLSQTARRYTGSTTTITLIADAEGAPVGCALEMSPRPTCPATAPSSPKPSRWSRTPS